MCAGVCCRLPPTPAFLRLLFSGRGIRAIAQHFVGFRQNVRYTLPYSSSSRGATPLSYRHRNRPDESDDARNLPQIFQPDNLRPDTRARKRPSKIDNIISHVGISQLSYTGCAASSVSVYRSLRLLLNDNTHAHGNAKQVFVRC